MARTVKEWIGRTDDSQPTDYCKLRILDRQGYRCALTGVEFSPANKPEFDHITPLWLGGENRESNLQAVTAEAHRRKTKAEATVRAKVKANTKRHLLGKKKSARPIPGSKSTRFKKLITGEVVDRRTGEVIS